MNKRGKCKNTGGGVMLRTRLVHVNFRLQNAKLTKKKTTTQFMEQFLCSLFPCSHLPLVLVSFAGTTILPGAVGKEGEPMYGCQF